MGKSYGLCDLRIGKVGNLVFRKVENKNVISEKPKYYPVNSAWLTREEFKQYVLSLLDVGIPQLYLLDKLPEEIYPYGLVFIQNDNATGVYLDKDGVRTHLQLGGGGGIDYVAQDPIAIDQLTRRISLKMGAGLHLDDEGRLVAEGEGGTYTAQLPITIDPETKTVGINLGLAFTVANEQLVLNLATDHGLGYLHDTLFLVTKDPITVDNAGIGVKTGDNLIVTQQGKLDVELHCGPGLRWDNTKTTYQEDTLRLRLGSVVNGSGTIEVTPSVDGDSITINALRYNTQASWNEQKEDDANLLGSGIIKKNVDSKVSKAGVQAPLSVNANDELVLGVGSGLELGDYGQNLQVRLGTGLKFDGTYHVALEDKISYEYGYQIVDGLAMFGVSSITVPAGRTTELRCTKSAVKGCLPDGWEPVPNAPLTLNATTTSFVIIGSGGVVGPTGILMYLRNIDNQNKTLNVLTFCLPCRKAL